MAITDSSQTIVQKYSYETFGLPTPSDPSFRQPYAFTAREWDRETGLYFYRTRYYDPMEGRFISKDPIAIEGNIYTHRMNIPLLQYVSSISNPYLYTENNPIRFIDPSGLLTTYYGWGAAAYYGNKGNTSGTAGGILYSDKTGWQAGNFATYGAEKAPHDGIETTLGAGAGTGPVVGFMTGSLDDFKGNALNLTLDLLVFGITYTENNAGEWGLSFGLGGKGVGFGYFMNETNTDIYSPRLNGPCD